MLKATSNRFIEESYKIEEGRVSISDFSQLEATPSFFVKNVDNF